eukprot:scaffold1033_cov65-Cyclotella_meneghiniana.AAC.9
MEIIDIDTPKTLAVFIFVFSLPFAAAAENRRMCITLLVTTASCAAETDCLNGLSWWCRYVDGSAGNALPAAARILQVFGHRWSWLKCPGGSAVERRSNHCRKSRAARQGRERQSKVLKFVRLMCQDRSLKKTQTLSSEPA